ncbi:hypothetical protein Ciccas_011445 [Cichlidogyrus casuarinus]|uniref:V-type proton ATPase subunit E n=1 Tax=Cichlidogyrus casuarinus TaxID=1844966 RepID=A0ABD2PSX4_9PLAT
MTLNETDVQKQLTHMKEFIALEAHEKCSEIDTKAEEEFQIEKSKLVQNQRLKIMELYSKKEKQLELAKKIQDSNLMNQSRIKILQSREKHIQMLLNEAREKLKEKTKDRAAYKKTLVGLIVQGLFQLLEKEVTLRCVRRDHDLVVEALKTALQDYTAKTKQPVNVKVDENNWLPDSVSGGIILVTNSNKITVVNTLESRLDQISDHLMPRIREILFGPNPNRKFKD